MLFQYIGCFYANSRKSWQLPFVFCHFHFHSYIGTEAFCRFRPGATPQFYLLRIAQGGLFSFVVSALIFTIVHRLRTLGIFYLHESQVHIFIMVTSKNQHFHLDAN